MRVDNVDAACAALERKVDRAGYMGNAPILEFGSQVYNRVEDNETGEQLTGCFNE